MATIDIIKRALSILNSHDFYYMMADYGYEKAERSAKASMKYFVEVTNTLPSDLREMMRNLWIAAYEYCACSRPFWTSPDIEEKKAVYENLKNQVNALVA